MYKSKNKNIYEFSTYPNDAINEVAKKINYHSLICVMCM